MTQGKISIGPAFEFRVRRLIHHDRNGRQAKSPWSCHFRCSGARPDSRSHCAFYVKQNDWVKQCDLSEWSRSMVMFASRRPRSSLIRKTFRSRIWRVVVYGLRNYRRNVRVKVNRECPVRFSPFPISVNILIPIMTTTSWNGQRRFSSSFYASHRHPTVSIVTNSFSFFLISGKFIVWFEQWRENCRLWLLSWEIITDVVVEVLRVR